MKRLLGLSLALLPVFSFADGMDAGPHANPIFQFLPLIVIIALLYFMMIRPQMKQSKEQRNLLTSLQVGDEVQTQSGIIGRVAKINDQYVDLNIAENIDIKILKKAITGAIPKGTMKSV